MDTIITLNTRSSVLLSVVQEHFNLDSVQMRREIISMHGELLQALAHKNIEYENLRSALVPSEKNFEAAFIFDSRDIDDSWYGLQVFEAIIDLLNRESTQCVRAGDLICDDQPFVREVMEESLILNRPLNYAHSTYYYCIYINNISKNRMELIDNGLKKHKYYVGYIPTTLRPLARYFLSTTLASIFLKHKSVILTSHEDDVPNNVDSPLSPYPFEDHGYVQRTLQARLYELFLTYKIERPYINDSISSEEESLSISSVSDMYIPLDKCSIEIEEAKYEYLLKNKLGKLKQAGLENLTRDELAEQIKSKIRQNYIYMMRYLDQHDVILFNTLLEFPYPDGYPVRVVVAFEYQPTVREIRLVTLH